MNRMSPKHPRTALVVLLTAALAAWLAASCAKKATEAPPTAAPVPAQPAPTPAPTPTTPAPTTPAATQVTSSDFAPAFFDYDSATLRDDARAALDANARLLRENSDMRITIEGHCDERGTVEYNQALGERRGQAAQEYLVAAGISASRMDVVSYGKDRPFDQGHDERAWAANRRAHFTVR